MQNLPNYFTTPNKMTSENDIKGLVSLKFLRPWLLHPSPPLRHNYFLSPNQIIPALSQHGPGSYKGIVTGEGFSPFRPVEDSNFYI
jgi:hypothetical protein